MDYWNNYEGALVAQEAIAIFGRNITNDQLADYVAAQVLQSAAEPPGAGRFIHDATLDSRATVAGFEEQRLPPENLSPDAIREAFAGHFGHCFVAGTMIDMWPTGSDILPDASGVYERAEVLAKVWQKPIEEITPSDWVVSFDEDGNLKPGKVTRTFVNQAKVILDFFGTGVTPGHAYYRADSKRAYKFEPLIDILRDDGVVQDSSGVLIRAATGVPVGDPHDRFVWAITGEKSEDGSGVKVKEKGRIRLGTRIISEDGRDFCVGDLIRAGNGIVSSEGLICVGDIQIPFHWAYGDLLPKPEDYILKRSGTTLDDIYKVAEWEGLRPNLPPPMVRDDGPVQPLSQSGLDLMPRNTPLAWCDERYAASSRPMLNRKKRRADGVSERQQAKARKQSVN